MVFLFLGSTENEIQILTDTNVLIQEYLILLLSYVIGHKLYLWLTFHYEYIRKTTCAIPKP